MAKQIAKLLKASIEDTSDFRKIAKDLAKKGRGGDSMLAHITPKEAQMLKSAGGAGTINPDTGLLEFYDWTGSSDYSDYSGSARTYSDPYVNTDVQVSRPATFGTDQFDYGNASYAYTPTRPAVDESFRGFQPQAQTFGTPDFYSQSDFYPRTAESGEYVEARRTDPTQQLGFEPSERDRLIYGTSPQELPAEKGYLEKLKEKLGQSQFLERLGLAGIGAIPGIYFGAQARKEGRRAREELERLAAPYQTQGKQLLEQAQRGELTAPAQQQVQALQARAAQGVAARGGVGAEQAAAQVEAFRQQLLANQYDLGLKVSGIGDQIAQGAIRTGLQADQYVNQLTATYYGNLFRDIGGLNQPVVPQNQQPR